METTQYTGIQLVARIPLRALYIQILEKGIKTRIHVEQEKRSVFLDVAEFGTNFAWTREKCSIFLYRDVEELGTSFSQLFLTRGFGKISKLQSVPIGGIGAEPQKLVFRRLFSPDQELRGQDYRLRLKTPASNRPEPARKTTEGSGMP